MSTPPRLRAHYVLSTHWDREWYQSFQNYRFQLVRLWDQVLKGIEDGRLQGPFQTDGQAIILDLDNWELSVRKWADERPLTMRRGSEA